MEQNSRLVEAFGALEKLCNDIYSDQHGVTRYIDDMTALNAAGSLSVPGWAQDYQWLKNTRHKRNKLSHGEVGFDSPYATAEDVAFLTDFRQRVLNRHDPLAVYYCRAAAQSQSLAAARHQDNKGISGSLLGIFVLLSVGLMSGLLVLAGILFRLLK